MKCLYSGRDFTENTSDQHVWLIRSEDDGRKIMKHVANSSTSECIIKKPSIFDKTVFETPRTVCCFKGHSNIYSLVFSKDFKTIEKGHVEVKDDKKKSLKFVTNVDEKTTENSKDSKPSKGTLDQKHEPSADL